MKLSAILATVKSWFGYETTVQPVVHLSDPAGRELREFLTEFRIDGHTFGDSVIAYALPDSVTKK